MTVPMTITPPPRNHYDRDQIDVCSRTNWHPGSESLTGQRSVMVLDGSPLCAPCFARGVEAGEFVVTSGNGIQSTAVEQPSFEVKW